MEQTHLPISHDPWLVGASFLIAIFASYAALTIISRLRQSSSSKNWLWLGAATYGLGVWAMHFTAMTALQINKLVSYDPLITLVSWFFAVLGAAAAFQMVSRPNVGPLQILGSGFFLGAGIGTMHYVGMLAMRLDAQLTFSPPLVVLSVLVAMVLGAFGMWMLVSPVLSQVPFSNLATATVTGLAIPFMHYTAMLAVRFTDTGTTQIHNMIASGSLVTLNIFVLFAVAVLGLPVFISSLLEAPTEQAQEAEA
ncbi:MHYT domain-containing protein [Meiothermus taiwanensis]|jgi:NO-binding membrane sensor protein with MHYT domain|uniref:Integral membrane sensor protein n=2 Tax=Meiothermus taiwanensis TaxID=172827 RepID=A0ABM6WG27_9DEIN|nr:MHYT domain-containing protein [Meiothermus taiwanensis]AWR85910.1 putative integral membrane sensor protein [Meiothermus taiwanensis WR-220]KIQ54663.1 integral membrane sensor protein [Meiothermus taiwanensis]KZK15502.1 integral membrane sensor protein [Meiothermus taiwanensis]RIH75815.1 putative signaling protein [Meiothermus taiwanensis]